MCIFGAIEALFYYNCQFIGPSRDALPVPPVCFTPAAVLMTC